jgi:hypothetical protein
MLSHWTVRFEQFLHAKVRSPTAHPKTLAVVLILVVMTVVFFGPLFYAGATSYEEASDICDARVLNFMTLRNDGDESAARDEINSANFINYPDLAHKLNGLSTLVSLAGFLMWLFASPHKRTEKGADLDRTCMAPSCFVLRAHQITNLFVFRAHQSSSG